MSASINIKATVADSLFSIDGNAKITDLSRRLDKARRRLTERLQDVSDTLDELLGGHPLEDRLRPLLFAPLLQEGHALLQTLDRVRTRLLLFIPPSTVEQLREGLDLQLEDIRLQAEAEQPKAADAPSEAQCAAGALSQIAGYWIDEDAHARLERALSAVDLLASVDNQTGRRASISHESLAATAQYVADDLKKVLVDAVFESGPRAGTGA
jgi:hypothetical protein